MKLEPSAVVVTTKFAIQEIRSIFIDKRFYRLKLICMDFLIILLSILVSGGFWLRFLYKYDKVEPEPIGVVLRVLLFGGILSVIPSAFCNSFWEHTTGFDMNSKTNSLYSSIFFSLFVGFDEEIFKALATVYLTKKLKELDEPIDAVVYSSAVGLGFAIIENFQYGFRYGVGNIAFRSVTALPLHIGLAVFWGAPIARVKFFPKTTYFGEMKSRVIAASFIHAGYDFILFYFKNPIFGLFTSLVIAYFLIRYVDKELKYLLTQTPFLPAGICGHCGTENDLKAKQCKKCGSNLVQEYFLVCSNCGTKLPLDYTTCSVCGAELKSENLFQDKKTW